MALLVLFHYGVEALNALRPSDKSVPAVHAGVAVSALEDESGVGLRLVGVDSSEPPVALLEDIRTGKTYFARQNETFRGARVKQISKNKVLISVHGKTLELR